MGKYQTTVFTTNRSQAVRIPKALAFPETVKKVQVTRVDDGLLIRPVGGTWAEFFESGPHVSEDFLRDREQGVAEERGGF